MVIYKFFKYLYKNIRYTSILNKVYKNEKIIENLSNLFNTKFKKDWIGRIYTVLNPNLMDDKYSINTQIFEYTERGLNNSLYIEKWVMERLNVAANFIQANNLFDLLTYDIKKIDEYDNYLLIIQPITLQDCLSYTKRFLILMGVLCIIGIIIFLI